MRAVVLVGGFGTRLRPLTLSRPKQMLPVGNRPMIERVLGHLADHGITSAVLALGYRADGFQDAYPSGRCAGVALHYAVEPEPLGTAGAVRFAALDAGIAEPFLVLNADVLTDLDVTALIADHQRSGAEGTLALHRVEDPSSFGVVPTDAAGRVTSFIEKPPLGEAVTDLINAGTYVLEPSVLDRIAPDQAVSIERSTFPAMVSDGTLHAMDGDTYWIDAGTPATYLAANLDLVNGRRQPVEPGVHADAQVDGAVVGSVVGAGVHIAEAALVSGSVVLPGAMIGAGALVQDAIIGEGASIGAGAVLDQGTVVGDEAVVPAGAHLTAVRIPEES